MDWRRLEKEANALVGVNQQGRDVRIKDLTQEDPELAEELKDYLTRTVDLGGFMQTSVSIDDDGLSDAPFEPGDQIGIWKIDSLIGRGGMGQVYKALRSDGLYEQTVALKVMLGDRPERLQRFEQERQRLAKLDHSGISRIIDGGATNDGRPFMAMEYIDGRPIDEFVKANDLKLQSVLKLFSNLCSAVAHAHGKFILHRDIKPANVLVDAVGNVRLIDFGIAALLDADNEEVGGPLTLAYAAPEQLRRESLSAATDIFMLGVLLHDVLTGAAPDRLENGAIQINSRPIQNADLVQIITKATAESPSERYVSVDALNDDIQAVLEKRPIAARRGNRLYRAKRFFQRFPVATLMGAGFVAALVAGITSSLNFASQVQSEANRTKDALERAEHYLDRSMLLNRTETAYADALHRMFGEEADVERVTGILLDHWRQARDLRNENPNRYAMISFTVGRHFVEREDYATGAEVLEPWISEGIGPKTLLTEAKMFLGQALRFSGREEDGLAYLREADEELSSGLDAGSYRHTLVKFYIAMETQAFDELAAATLLAYSALDESGLEPEEEAAILNNLGVLLTRQSDFNGAHEAARAAVQLVDDNPLFSVGDKNSIRMNLAAFEVYHNGDHKVAEEQISILINEQQDENGLGGRMGTALNLLAEISAERGDYADAEAKLREAVEIEGRFFGEGSFSQTVSKVALAEVLCAAGKIDEAAKIFEDMEKAAEADGKNAYRHPRIIAARAYYLAHADDLESASEYLSEKGFTKSLAARSLVGTFLVRKLGDLGVVIGD